MKGESVEFTADEDGRLEIELTRPFGDETPQVRAFATSEGFGVVIDGLMPGEIVDVATQPHKRSGNLTSRRDAVKALHAADRKTNGYLTQQKYREIGQQPGLDCIIARLGLWSSALNMADVARPEVECCPACESTNYNARKTISPTYRCDECGHEFDELSSRPAKN